MASNIRWEKNIGRRFQLRDLQVFFTVAEHSSMAKAALELGVTQPSVSATIAGLETALRTRLFERSPKGVELTPVGQALLARGRAAFDELHQGIRDIEFLSEPDAGEVKIGCPELIASGFLPAVIAVLSRKYPRVSLEVVHLNTPTLEFRMLDERRLDLVLAMLAAPDANNAPAEYSVEILFEDRLCVITSRNSPLARRRRIDLNELSKLPWVVRPANTPGVSWVAEMFRKEGVEFPTRRVTTWSVHLSNNMASTGQFITITPESAFLQAADRYGLKELPVNLPAPRWPVAAVTLRHRKLSPVVNLFLECARTAAKTYMDRRRRQ